MITRQLGASGALVVLALAELGGVRSAAHLADRLGADRHAVAAGLAAAADLGLVERVHARGWRLNGGLNTIQPHFAFLNGGLSTFQVANGAQDAFQGAYDDDEEAKAIVARVRYLYASEIGPVTELVERSLQRAIRKYDRLSAWEHAFEAAAGRNARNLNYVLACVRRYENPLEPVRVRG